MFSFPSCQKPYNGLTVPFLSSYTKAQQKKIKPNK